MNAWIAQFRELRRSLVVIASDMVATEPIPERLAELGLTSGLCVSDARLLVNYYRRTDDGRIAWGKGGGGLAFGGRVGTRFDGSSPRAAAVAADLRRIYPQLGDTRITHSWTGPIDRTPTGLPYVGRLEGRDDLHYVYGFSGNGVGPAHLSRAHRRLACSSPRRRVGGDAPARAAQRAVSPKPRREPSRPSRSATPAAASCARRWRARRRPRMPAVLPAGSSSAWRRSLPPGSRLRETLGRCTDSEREIR